MEQARIDGFVKSTEEYGTGEQRVALPSASCPLYVFKNYLWSSSDQTVSFSAFSLHCEIQNVIAER